MPRNQPIGDQPRKHYNHCMDEITIGDKVYISSKRAAKITGYAKDYVGQLCREGRVEARLVGRSWYVLESSIREHRFGKETVAEDTQPEGEAPAPKAAPVAEKPGVNAFGTWKEPQYQPVQAPAMPALAPKPEAPRAEEHQAIADMQSAWKEWFEGKPQLEALPEGEKEEAPVYVPEAREEEPAVPVREVLEEVEAEVPLTRTLEERESNPEPEIEEEVSIHRSYASFETGERIPPTEVPVVDLSAPVVRERSAKASSRPRKARAERSVEASSGVWRALLIVLAVAFALVAVVGTGNAERFLSGTSLDFGVQKSVIDFLEGTSSFNNKVNY